MDITNPQNPPSTAAGAVESGLSALGIEPGAFSPAGGPVSAAHAEWLRRVHDRKLYRSHSNDWGEFCQTRLGLSGARATEIIGILEEFGPAYFHLASVTPVTPEEFRTFASKIRGRFLCVAGQPILLVPKNAKKIAAAMEKLRRPTPPQPRGRRTKYPHSRVTLLESRCKEVTGEFRKLSQPAATDVDRLHLAAVLRKTLTMLGRIEMELGIY